MTAVWLTLNKGSRRTPKVTDHVLVTARRVAFPLINTCTYARVDVIDSSHNTFVEDVVLCVNHVYEVHTLTTFCIERACMYACLALWTLE